MKAKKGKLTASRQTEPIEEAVFTVITFKNGRPANNYEDGYKVITPVYARGEIAKQVSKWAFCASKGEVAYSYQVYDADRFSWEEMRQQVEKHNQANF